MEIELRLNRSMMAPVCLLALAETCINDVANMAVPGSRPKVRADDLLYKIHLLSGYYQGKFPPKWYPAVETAFFAIEKTLSDLCDTVNATDIE